MNVPFSFASGTIYYAVDKDMNDLTNYIEKRLKEYGVTIYRNERIGNINRWTADSTYLGVDLHLAIHCLHKTYNGHSLAKTNQILWQEFFAYNLKLMHQRTFRLFQ